MVGLTASLHCVGMCGPLVMTITKNPLENFIYHLGRLLGYSLLTIFIGLVGQTVWQGIATEYKTAFIVVVAAAYIFIGLRQFSSKTKKIGLPKNLDNIYRRILAKTINSKMNGNLKSLIFGSLSVLLPCGVLYGFILGMVSIHSLPLALLSVLLFWMGTLPALSIVSGLFQKFSNPLNKYYPRIIGTSYLCLGLGIIGYRYYISLHAPAGSCH